MNRVAVNPGSTGWRSHSRGAKFRPMPHLGAIPLRKRPASLPLSAAWAFMVVTACGAQEGKPRATALTAPRPSTAAEPKASSTAPATSASASTPAAPSAAATGDLESSTPKLPPPYKPGTFRCGTALCKAKQEVCCPSTKACLAASEAEHVVAPDGQVLSNWPKTHPACTNPHARFATVTNCDDSSDCGPGTRCCMTDDFGLTCQQSCDEQSEACRVTENCTGRDTKCAEGVCRRPHRMKCGRETCSADKPFCCRVDDGSQPFCGTSEACGESSRTRACLHAGHCAPGEWCYTNMGNTFCMPRGHGTNAQQICERASHCSPDYCDIDAKRRPKCVDGMCDCT